MHRLASYDINKPTEAIISFDDSDDDQTSNYNFDENTTNNHSIKDIKSSNAFSNSDTEAICKNDIKSSTQESNDTDPNTEKYNERRVKDKHLSEESKKDLPPTQLKELVMETEIVEEVLNSLDENNLVETKKRRHSEHNSKLPEKVIKLEPQNVQKLCNDECPPEIKTQKSPTPANETQEFVYVNKLLYRVSDSLLYIIKAFSLHTVVQNSNEDQNQINKSMTNFLRLKYKLFQLCFVIVENIMVPNAGNEEFIRQFTVDTIKLGSERSVVCTQQQIEEVLKELLAWTHEKKNAHNNTQVTIKEILENHKTGSNESTFNNNLLLKTQLQKPLKLPNNNSPLEEVDALKTTINNSLSKSIVNSNMPLPCTNFSVAPFRNFVPYTNNASLIQANYGQRPNKNVPTDPANSVPMISSNNISAISVFHGSNMPSNCGQALQPETCTNLVLANNSPAASANNSTRKLGNAYATYKDIENKDDITEPNNDMSIKNLESYVECNSLITPLSGKPNSNVIFSSGPPGQQVSITIDHSVLKQQQQLTNANVASYHKPIYTVKKTSILNQRREIYTQLSPQNCHQRPLHQQQLPQQQFPQQKLPQQLLRQQQLLQQQLPQQKMPQKQLPQQQFPHLQMPSQHLPVQPTPKQYLRRNQTNQRWQVPHSNDDPRRHVLTQPQQAHPYYPQNALPQNKVPRPPPPYWQHQNTFPQPLPPFRTLEQNEQRAQPEITRSSSNDSGFTSPLNFNSPGPTNAQVILFRLLFCLSSLVNHLSSK